jgi:hypothetical protein
MTTAANPVPDSVPRLTIMRDGEILDVPTVAARSLYERWLQLLEDLHDTDRQTQEAIHDWMRDDGHPCEHMSRAYPPASDIPHV